MLTTEKNDVQSLGDMYDKILTYATTGLRHLRDITQRDLKGTHYDILVNVLWA